MAAATFFAFSDARYIACCVGFIVGFSVTGGLHLKGLADLPLVTVFASFFSQVDYNCIKVAADT